VRRRFFNEHTTEKYLASAVNRDTAAGNAPKAKKGKTIFKVSLPEKLVDAQLL
jgi:hypothetical protein